MRLTVTRYRAYLRTTGASVVVGGASVVVAVVGGGAAVVGDLAGAAVCAFAGTAMARPSAIATTNLLIGSLHLMSDN
jgi:hypothetical protein